MVRERSVSYLDENRAAYEEFLGGREKFDEYLANMRRDKVRFFPVLYFIPGGSTELFGFVSDSSSSLHPLKTWGDEMTLCGACNAFECVINGKGPNPLDVLLICAWLTHRTPFSNNVRSGQLVPTVLAKAGRGRGGRG